MIWIYEATEDRVAVHFITLETVIREHFNNSYHASTVLSDNAFREDHRVNASYQEPRLFCL